MTNSDLYQKRIVGILSRIDPFFGKYGLDPQLKTVFSKENLQELPIFSYVKSTTKALLNGLSDLTMIGIYLLFLLKDSDKFSFTKHGIGRKISIQVNRYLSTKVLTSLITGVTVGSNSVSIWN